MFLIIATVDDWDATTWTVGYVERPDEVETVLARLHTEHRENCRILGPLLREERVFRQRQERAEAAVVAQLAVHPHDYDLQRACTKGASRAWIRRLNAYLAKREELAMTSLDRHPLPSRLERITYSARELRNVALDSPWVATQDA